MYSLKQGVANASEKKNCSLIENFCDLKRDEID